MRKRRSGRYRKYWKRLLETYGEACYYCREMPTVIDHIIPVSAGGPDDFLNLVPSCALCNLLASNKVFDSLEAKDDYIRKQRRKLNRRTRAICIDCLLPFQYRVHSPGLLLCAECYDLEFDTEHAKKRGWRKWIKTLILADFDVEAHRKTGEIVRRREGVKEAEKYRILWNFYYDIENDENDESAH